MQSIHVEHISKRFGDTQAVKDISFDVVPGEIFGLLGPNGSGKTTSIRIILDIFKPDSGSVSILGGPMSEAKKNQIGYLPEERGLYQDILLDKCLEYLATLKGMSPQQIKQKLPAYLEEFDLSAHKKKKVKELSKGMQQKAQIISTILHQPELIISEVLLPKVDGFALRERLRQNSSSQAIPFFFLSHLKDHEGIQRALALDVDVEHYLQKPYILPELIGLVLLKFRQKRALQF